jgi:hypothetical protein
VRQRNDDDVVTDDLVRQREREAIEHSNTAIVSGVSMAEPLREPADQARCRDLGPDEAVGSEERSSRGFGNYPEQFQLSKGVRSTGESLISPT